MRRSALVYAGLFMASFVVVLVLRRPNAPLGPQMATAVQQSTGSALTGLASRFVTQIESRLVPAATSKVGAPRAPARSQATPPQDLTAGLSKIAVPDPKLSYDDSLRRRFRAEQLMQDLNAATVPVDRINGMASLRDFAAREGDPGGEILSLMRVLVADDDPDVARTAKQITWQLTGGN